MRGKLTNDQTSLTEMELIDQSVILDLYHQYEGIGYQAKQETWWCHLAWPGAHIIGFDIFPHSSFGLNWLILMHRDLVEESK
jgi:hypothetical protein